MASKAKPAEAANALRAEAERLIAREKYKDAVKQAKLCYKEAATPEHHRLLERAYFLRARQLVRQGMRSSAVEVAQHLLDFGVTGSDAPEELIRLLAGLGLEKAAMALQAELGTADLSDQVTRTVADQLVIHPGAPGSASAELVREAGLVRRALEALRAGDEAGASALLRDLPRSSPLSEWKLFVRGLAAFWRGDDAESRASWDRLDAGRAPLTIARRLRRMAEEASGASGAGLEAAESLAFGEPVLDRIRRLGQLVAAQDWDKALLLLGPLRLTLRRIDPKLPERLTRILIEPVIKAAQGMDPDSAFAMVERFCRAAEPPAIDPKWNRFLALIWDGPQGEPAGAIHYWTLYVEDLAGVAALAPAERDLARALVWNQIAERHAEEVEGLRIDEGPPPLRRGRRPGKPRRESPEIAEAKRDVVAALERSLKLAPDHLETYRQLVAAFAEWGDNKGLEAAALRLLEKAPEDVETLERLARHHHDRKDPRAALPFVLRARRLRPLDETLRILEWSVHVGMARVHALEGKFDEGRAEFAAAEAIEPAERQDFSYLVRRAVFEYKAGRDEDADRLIAQAREKLAEPAPLFLAMLVEFIRYKMPKDRVADCERLLDAELKKKRRSETVGALAGLMASYLAAGVEYPGRAGHVEKILGYIRKTTTLKYRREDIEHVAEFLSELMPGEEALFKKLVKAGVKQHPDSALLHYYAGGLALTDVAPGPVFGRGRFGRDPSYAARRHMETALHLAETSDDPKVKAMVPMLRERLGLIEEVGHAMYDFARGLDLPPGLDLDAIFGEELDDDEELDDFDEGPPSPAPRRVPAPKKKGKGRRKK